VPRLGEQYKLTEVKMKRVKESEAGVCPTCGSYNIDYESLEIDSGDSVYYPAICEKCGQEFREYYDMTFNTHYVEEAKYDETT